MRRASEAAGYLPNAGSGPQSSRRLERVPSVLSKTMPAPAFSTWAPASCRRPTPTCGFRLFLQVNANKNGRDQDAGHRGGVEAEHHGLVGPEPKADSQDDENKQSAGSLTHRLSKQPRPYDPNPALASRGLHFVSSSVADFVRSTWGASGARSRSAPCADHPCQGPSLKQVVEQSALCRLRRAPGSGLCTHWA